MGSPTGQKCRCEDDTQCKNLPINEHAIKEIKKALMALGNLEVGQLHGSQRNQNDGVILKMMTKVDEIRSTSVPRE
jgi:hypothetical protein